MKSKINVLHFNVASSMGGSETMITLLLKYLDREKYQLFHCTLQSESLLNQRVRALRIPSTALGIDKKRKIIFAIPKLYHLICEKKIQILHLYGLQANVVGRLVAKFCKVPIVITAQRSTDDWRKWYHTLMDRFTFPYVDLIISNSFAAKKRLMEREKFPESKIAVIHNGIELPKFRETSQETKQRVRNEFNLSPEELIVGTVARLHPVKGHQYLLEAAKIVLKKFPETKFILVGEGPLGNKLKSLSKTLGIRQNLIFTGFRKDIPEILSTLDIFVLPSLLEGCPGSIQEAMAMRKPIVATKVGGIPEIVIDKITGFLIKPRDSKDLAETIIKLLKNKKTREEMGKEGKKVIETKFTLEKMVKETEDIYEKLIEKKLGF